MIKRPKRSWLENNTFLKIFSIFVALVIWVIVALTNPDDYSQVFRKVPVDASFQSETLVSLGLNTIEIGAIEADAVVYGDMGVVSRLKQDDLAATIEIPANLTTAGTYDLNLIPANENSDYRIEYSPRRVRVKLDRLVQKTFEVEPVIVGLAVPPGYILDEKITVNPSKLEISGPQVELDNIARCVIRADFTKPLESIFAGEFPITLLDAQGNAINPDERHITMGSITAHMVVTVLREKELPLIVEFTNIPRGFPLEELSYSMSSYELLIAGPTDLLDRYQEVIAGFIDLRQVSPTNRNFTMDIALPSSQLISLDGVNSVNLSFNVAGWGETDFTVTDILLVNPPSHGEAQLLTSAIYNVTIVGDKDTLEGISADDIVAEVDLSERELVEGQQKYPVKISLPGKGLVWATGEYSVVIQVTS